MGQKGNLSDTEGQARAECGFPEATLHHSGQQLLGDAHSDPSLPSQGEISPVLRRLVYPAVKARGGFSLTAGSHPGRETGNGMALNTRNLSTTVLPAPVTWYTLSS